MGNITTKIDVLTTALERKSNFLSELLKLTKEQNNILDNDEVDLSGFEKIVSQKQRLINQVTEIDEGFEELFNSIKGVLNTNKDLYKEQIQKMKEFIVIIGELSIEISYVEAKNKDKFSIYIRNQKREIKDYRTIQTKVNNYAEKTNNLANQNTSFFFDSKK